jgi:diacylglycerol kinase (ATP)
VNPASGRGRGAACVAAARALPELDVRVMASREELAQEARRAVAEGLERLLVAGGDGTMHHAIQQLAGSRCALGIVPVGSGNDLARCLDIPLQAEPAIRRALAGSARRIDLGRIGTRLFALAASVGFDAEAARVASEGVRWLRGPSIYLYAALRASLGFRPRQLSVTCDELSFSGRAMMVVLANARCYGGGIAIAPAAALDDGWLDLVLVRELPLLRFLSLLPRATRGQEVSHPAILRARVRQAVLTCTPASSFYGDGEALGVCPAPGSGATVEIVPGAMAVLT